MNQALSQKQLTERNQRAKMEDRRAKDLFVLVRRSLATPPAEQWATVTHEQACPNMRCGVPLCRQGMESHGRVCTASPFGYVSVERQGSR